MLCEEIYKYGYPLLILQIGIRLRYGPASKDRATLHLAVEFHDEFILVIGLLRRLSK
jgi:hypothetical protein